MLYKPEWVHIYIYYILNFIYRVPGDDNEDDSKKDDLKCDFPNSFDGCFETEDKVDMVWYYDIHLFFH